jgi:UDP-2,3-diacylglucosamine pyrophosphatase LpxH
MLWNRDKTADKIVVVSDLHFGIDDRFAQNVSDRSIFVDFIDKIIDVGDVRELVIAGDFLDEWIVPLSYPSHSDSSAFYQQCISNNRQVFDALGEAIKAGIKVVYVPGNHDMTLTEDVLAAALPGLVQARDANGLGVYITGDRNEIAIEHCHRYDVYSAPDAVSNRDLVGNDRTLLPPGYFYARLGTEWFAEEKPSNTVDYPVIAQAPPTSDIDQTGAYLHYKVMTSLLLTQYTPNIAFDEKVFTAQFAGLTGLYSEYDICPRMMEDGTISAPTLYRDFQRTWDERQSVNEVKVKLPFIEAISGTGNAGYFRSQASTQYLENPNNGIEVVVFGHTHIPDFHDFGDNRYYVNDGTWIDNNLDAGPTRTFAVITTGTTDSAMLCQYGVDGSISNISSDSVDA